MAKGDFFYGTPLSSVLEKEAPSDSTLGPINQKRARLDRQQTVRDEQGRQRFHGAFTGGFSAGYFNTVDSVEGFKPKQFVSHRGEHRPDQEKTFNHKPEDYMDEEDLGEFGIAPKKLRVINEFSTTPPRQLSPSRHSSSRPFKTMGEKILDRLDLESSIQKSTSIVGRGRKFGNVIDNHIDRPKSDYHGLGYKPLNRFSHPEETIDHGKNAINSTPLSASLSKGKRLTISGEAFGTGVVYDRHEDYEIDNSFYREDLTQYKFNTKSGQLRDKLEKSNSTSLSDLRAGPARCIRGFSQANNVDMNQFLDDVMKNHPPPEIEDDWEIPVGELITPQICPSNSKAHDREIRLSYQKTSDLLGNKFSSSQSLHSSDDIMDKRSGLLKYTDLKATTEELARKVSRKSDLDESLPTTPSVTRKQFEWRPCGLLCKRFNVPNPYPESSFVGLKPSSASSRYSQPTDLDSSDRRRGENSLPRSQASLEVKRSIFDSAFSDTRSDGETDSEEEFDSSHHNLPRTQNPFEYSFPEGEKPVQQMIDEMISKEQGSDEIITINDNCLHSDDDDNDDCDIAIVPIEAPKPEVITIDSSSSSGPPSPENLSHSEAHPDSDSDSYGPPLPPG